MAVSTDERTTEGEATDIPLLVAALVFLLFTWLVVFGWLALLTEILLTPWDLIHVEFRPPAGSWSRSVNDFFEGSRGDRLLGQIVVGVSAAAFVFRLVRARRRHLVAQGFIGANLLYLIGGFALIMMALAVSGQLFSGYGTPVGVGLHGRALPLAVLATLTAIFLAAQWVLEVRSAPDHGIALGWIWDRRPGKTFGWSSYLVLGFSAVLTTAVLTLVVLGLSVDRWPPLPIHATPQEAQLEACLNAVRPDTASAETLQQEEASAGIVAVRRWKPHYYDATGPANYLSANLVVRKRFGWRVECRASTTLGRVESGFAAGRMRGDSVAPVSYGYGVSDRGSGVRVEWADGQVDTEALYPNGSFLVVRDAVVRLHKVDLLDTNDRVLETVHWP
ncbi:MAG: hypothetical protein ACYC5J_16070 [Chloroflexota bacterium]